MTLSTDSVRVTDRYRVCMEVTHITPVNTSRNKVLNLAILKTRTGTWVVYQYKHTDPSNWKQLMKVNSTVKATKALHTLMCIYKAGTYIETFNILNTFKYIYGYKGKLK